MDEAEKYKQRLEAIAEKRRLQEEQERAKREMEDERLRLQQLKRKSLRDQWLMEGAPLSPTSLDSLSSRSPLWGFQTAETNQQTEKSQSESQQLAEEEDKVPMEVGQMEKETLVEAKDAGKETTQDDIVQNGENNAAISDEAQVKTNQDPLLNETTISLTNGTTDLKSNTNHSALDPSTQSTTNGPICSTEVILGLQSEPGLSTGLSVSEAEPDKTNIFNINEEDTEDSVVMRAQCVMITDEEEDVSENLENEKGQQETIQSEKSPKQEEESVEGVQKIEDQQTVTQPEESEKTEATLNAQPVSGDADGINTNENTDEETKVDVQGQSASQETSTVAQVPVYSENMSSSFSPEAEGSPEGAEAAIKVQDPDTTPGQFQEVPLSDPQENQKTEVGVQEQEPLLEQSKAPNTQAAPQGTSGPAGTVQGEEIKTPKHKSCQCCTIM